MRNFDYIIEVKNYVGELVGGLDDYEWKKYKTTPGGDIYLKNVRTFTSKTYLLQRKLSVVEGVAVFYCRKRKDLVMIDDNIVFMLLAAMCLAAFCFDLAVEFAKGLATLRECNVKVEAVLRYIDKVDDPNDHYKHYMYYPVFTYEYEGINYTSSSQRRLYFLEKRRYYNHESERFMIRINGENPRRCVQGSILEPAGFFLISMAFMTWFFKRGKLL